MDGGPLGRMVMIPTGPRVELFDHLGLGQIGHLLGVREHVIADSQVLGPKCFGDFRLAGQPDVVTFVERQQHVHDRREHPDCCRRGQDRHPHIDQKTHRLSPEKPAQGTGTGDGE